MILVEMAFRSLRFVQKQNACLCLISDRCQGLVSGTKCLIITIRKNRRYSTDSILITPVDEAKRFIKDCFIAVDTPPEHAETVANNLIEADYRGIYSHGMNRLEMYVRDIKQGSTDPKAEPVIENETVATALVDGKNGLGAVIGKRCMEIAINKAKEAGIGFVVAKGSNHFGIAGIYSSQAIEAGLVGLAFTNTSPFMTPTRAKQTALGTNPLSVGAPGLQGDNFLLDMATTAVAVGKIELSRRKNEPIPEGWALNDDGMPETNPAIAYKSAKLMPLGGTEAHSGYKGYGLGMLVEIFCGILSGAAYGPNIRQWGDSVDVANLGQAFMAIDPKAFAPGFAERLSDLMSYLRNMEPVDPQKPVIVHGDRSKAHKAKVNQEGGLQYVDNQHKTNAKLAQELKVKPMLSKPICNCSNK